MDPSDRDRPDALSVMEMLRIMDVATALRQDREVVEEQLDRGTLKQRLKERMLAASGVMGEAVTPEEVDAAIDQYYARLHTFREPPPGPSVALAHLWVLRRTLLRRGGVALASVALGWWLFLSPSGPLTITGRARKRVERLAAEIAGRGEAIRGLARDGSVAARVAGLAVEAEASRRNGDPKGLQAVRDDLAGLEARLREEYAVSVVAGSGRQSAVDRYHDGGRKVSGYYLIVEARRPDGTVVRRRVRDDETGRDREVATWGERVPEAVYDRLERDKAEDGILNETAFAAKRRGLADEEITMPGPGGKPLERMGRITEW